MSQLNEQGTGKKAVESFELMIENEISASNMADTIDKVIYKYSCYLLKDTGFSGGGEEADEIYYLRCLRDVLQGKPVFDAYKKGHAA